MVYVIAIIVVMALTELLIRTVISNQDKRKIVEARKQALDSGLRHDFSSISNTLRRIELQNPNARLLIVDRDEQILDKLRNMLVLDGYSVDSVVSGNEAVELTMLNHYDFVLSGEKTRDISGNELTKKVQERRSDMNIIIITEGVAAATPYDLIREGAIDFIRLNDFVRKQLNERRQKIAKELKQKKSDINLIPAGLFLTPSHLWFSIEANGRVKVGIDKFAATFIGLVETIDFANLNIHIEKHNPLFIIKKNYRDIRFISPFDGRVVSANVKLREHLYQIGENPYINWICSVEPDMLESYINSSMLGQSAEEYIKNDIALLEKDLKNFGLSIDDNGEFHKKLSDEQFNMLYDKYFNK